VPRQNRRKSDDRPDREMFTGAAGHRRDEFRGETYLVRPVAGAAAGKAYRCPGCDQEIRAGAAHLVVWPEHDDDATDRRHWHTACWAARDRRGPGVQRSRSAPRY
jgi:hypothetical protein